MITQEKKDRYNFNRRVRYQNNKELFKEKNARWYQKNKATHRSLSTKYRKTFQEKANAFKLSKGCIDCGYKEHAVALHFDHVTGKKVRQICDFRNWDLALEEVSKCVVRCSNCHAIKTFKNKEFRGWRKRIDN
jgi:hypothetical protein